MQRSWTASGSTFLDRLFVSVAAVCLLGPALWDKPRVLGDAVEYLLMAESLWDHASADLRDEDRRALLHPRNGPRIDGPLVPPLGSYVADGDGRAHAVHFWAYPLLCLPAKALLRVFRGNELKAFQLTNAAFALLAVVTLVRRGGDPGRALAALLLLSPFAAFVLWPHPEAVSCSLVAISLGRWREGRATAATLGAAFASLQAAPLVCLAAFFWWQARDSRAFGIRALGPTLALLVAAWPFIFYLVHYGRLTLLPLVGAADLGQASPWRAGELFFDLNLGMLPYVPACLLGAVLAPLTLFATRRPVGPSLGLWCVLGAIAVACSAAVNWNHGTAGPSRYAIWMLPLLLFLFVRMLDRTLQNARVRGAFGALALVAAATQAAVVIGRGGIDPGMDHVRHSYLATFVLEHEPSLYSPSPEIFAERTLGREVPYGAIPNREPITYRAGRECRKALAQKRHWPALLARCGAPRNAPGFSPPAARNQRGEWLYVDY
jgi:hypothetical protein